jgi:O-methyltransferase
MDITKNLKKYFKIKLSSIIKYEWHYVERLNSLIKFSSSPVVKSRFDIYNFIIENELKNVTFNYLEFGVFKGETIKFWVNNCANANSLFIGFDTFTGLPEDWNSRKKGSYSADGLIPYINDTRVKFVKGLFQKTLTGFLQKEYKSEYRSVIHLDADLYSATLFVLSSFLPYLKKGDIIIFDEFGFELNHEFRAFIDFIDLSKINYKIICATKEFRQVAIQIL